jgi:hypothetical protein
MKEGAAEEMRPYARDNLSVENKLLVGHLNSKGYAAGLFYGLMIL